MDEVGTYIIYMKVKGKGVYTVAEAMEAVTEELKDPDWESWETTSFYLTTGEYDLVLIGSAPDDIAVGLAISLTQTGYVSTTVAQAYTAAETTLLPMGIQKGLIKHN